MCSENSVSFIKVTYSSYSKNIAIPKEKLEAIENLVFCDCVKISRNSAMILLENTRVENGKIVFDRK